MKSRSLLSYFWVCFFALASAYTVLHSWSLRHSSLVFFGHYTNMLWRYFFNGLLFLFLFVAQHRLLKSWTSFLPAKKASLYLFIDLFSYALLPFCLLYRDTLDSRSLGNQFYLCLFLFWALFKALLFYSVFDQLSVSQLGRLKESWALKNKRLKKKILQKQPISLHFFLALILLFFILILSKTSERSLLICWASFAQALLIVACLWAIQFILSFWTFKPSFTFYTLSGFCLLFYLLDSISLRSVNLHVWDIYNAVFSEGFFGAVQFLEGADLTPHFCALLLLFALSLPFLSAFFLTKISMKKKSFFFSAPALFLSFALTQSWIVESKLSEKLSFSSLKELQHALSPLTFFFKPKEVAYSFNQPLSLPPTEEVFQKELKAIKPSKVKQPHVFLFVIESYRADLLNEQTSPFLAQFSKEAASFKKTASNSNVTHCSLFTLFHGQYPHHWVKLRNQCKTLGSFPLRALKERGYELNAFHSSFFKYFDIGESIFGKEHHLLKRCYEAKHLHPDVAKRDEMVKEKVIQWLQQEDFESPQFTTILLDSTHHHYYWPDSFKAPFQPYQKNFNYTSRSSKQLQLTKNRYYNALYYVDSLLKDIIHEIQKKGLYEEALIVITGDHGEEFMEKGHYFHGTDLCFVQSNVPLLYKLPQGCSKTIQKELTSHIDFFPSLFDLLDLKFSSEVLKGRSIFSNGPNFILSFKPDQKKDPYQFYYYDGSLKLEAKLNEPSALYTSNGIEVKALKDFNEEELNIEALEKNPHLLSLIEKELFD